MDKIKWNNPKIKHPKLGEKVLVKQGYKSGKTDYNIAIYAISHYDRRKRGYFQNYDNQLLDGNIMNHNSWLYTNIIGWAEINDQPSKKNRYTHPVQADTAAWLHAELPE